MTLVIFNVSVAKKNLDSIASLYVFVRNNYLNCPIFKFPRDLKFKSRWSRWLTVSALRDDCDNSPNNVEIRS